MMVRFEDGTRTQVKTWSETASGMGAWKTGADRWIRELGHGVESCLGWVPYTEERKPRVGDVAWHPDDPPSGITILTDSLPDYIPRWLRWTGCPHPECSKEEPHDVDTCCDDSEARALFRIHRELMFCRGWVPYTEDRKPRVGDVVRYPDWQVDRWSTISVVFTSSILSDLLRWTGCPRAECRNEEPHDVDTCCDDDDSERDSESGDSDEPDVDFSDECDAGIAGGCGACEKCVPKWWSMYSLRGTPELHDRLSRALFRIQMQDEIHRRAEFGDWSILMQDNEDAKARMNRIEAVMWDPPESMPASERQRLTTIRVQCESQADKLMKAMP